MPGTRVLTQDGSRAPIRVGTQAGFADCEQIIAGCRASDQDRPLLLSTDWRLQTRPGGFAAAAQMIITWARHQRSPVLLTHSSGCHRDATLDRFCERPHGMIAAMMAASVLDGDGGGEIRVELNGRVRRHVDAMDVPEPRTTRGQALFLMCVDHSTRARIKALYTSGPRAEVRDASEFRDIIANWIAAVSPRHGLRKATLPDDLATAMHELFDNTHVHARVDAEGQRYARSVRCINVAERAMPATQRPSGAVDLDAFVRATAQSSRSPHNTRFIEIAIVDSGPGLASTISGLGELGAIEIEREAELVRACFRHRKSSRERAAHGYGLPRVMEAIRAHRGFIRVRTGRLSLFRSFEASAPGQAGEPHEEAASLRDSATLSEEATAMAEVAGTAVTILIPVNIEDA